MLSRSSTISTQTSESDREPDASEVEIGPEQFQGLRTARLKDENFASEAVMPCVVYECSSDLVVTAVTANTSELIGIEPERIIGKRTFWQERMLTEDRDSFVDRLNQLALAKVASQIHKVTDDRGLPVWIAHSFRKLRRGDDYIICGCMVPLANELCAGAVDNAIVAQFIHKIGNHFQLINLLNGSLARTGTNSDEIDALQQTVDRAVEFTRSFSHYTQPAGCFSGLVLGEILRSVVKSMASAFFEKSVELNDRTESSVASATITGDAFLLEVAFRSVLQNALEATKSGDQVVIRGWSELGALKERPVAHIAIVDTGCGIEKQTLGRVADPFVTSKGGDRDGLGLSTAVRIVEIHGGTLKVSSAPAQGTTVDILLPVSGSAR